MLIIWCWPIRRATTLDDGEGLVEAATHQLITVFAGHAQIADQDQ
jgi:hypothetical protein